MQLSFNLCMAFPLIFFNFNRSNFARSTAYTPASPYDPPHAASPALSSHPLR